MFTTGLGALWNMDAFAFMATLADESIDMCITDPPYGISDGEAKTRFLNGVPATVNYGEWDKFASEAARDEFYAAMWRELYRVARPGAFCCVWTDRLFVGVTERLHARPAGWRLWEPLYTEDDWFASPAPLMARKINPAPRWRTNRRQSTAEFALLVVKPGARPTWRLPKAPHCGNVLEYRIGDKKTAHPTEKPESVIEPVLLSCAADGALVLDPFCGGGTVPAVCERLGMRWIACDAEREWCEATRKRLGG